MGRLIKEHEKNSVSRCSYCGRESDHSDGYFVYDFQDLLAQSEDAQRAYEWFSSRNFDVPPSDVRDKGYTFTKEEIGHIFVLEEFIDRIMEEKPACLSCYKRK